MKHLSITFRIVKYTILLLSSLLNVSFKVFVSQFLSRIKAVVFVKKNGRLTEGKADDVRIGGYVDGNGGVVDRHVEGVRTTWQDV